jgi:hypothetical protein
MLGLVSHVLAALVTLGIIACSGPTAVLDGGPTRGRVTRITSMAAARSGHTSTLLPSGDVLIAGGMNGNGNYSDAVELFRPATNTFTPAPGMDAKRVGHTATLLPNGKVLIAGGFNGDYLSSAIVFDPATGNFTPTGRMTAPRSEHVAVLLGSGKVLVAGGVGTGYTFLASAELYDPATGEFAPTGSMTTPRESHTATLLENGRVLVAGGHKDRRAAMTVFASAELYDPATGTFAATGSMTTVRHKHGAALLADGNVLIVGGSDKRDWHGRYNTAEIYDSARGVFRPARAMKGARFKLANAVVTLANGKVIVAGGSRDVELYDPTTDAYERVDGHFDTARFFSAATLLRDGRILITGGYDEQNVATARSWIYNG